MNRSLSNKELEDAALYGGSEDPAKYRKDSYLHDSDKDGHLTRGIANNSSEKPTTKN